MVENILGFLCRILRIERHEHRANAGCRENGKQELGTVRQQKRDPFTVFHSQPQKPVGNPIDFALHLTVSPKVSPECQGEFVRMTLYAVAEQLR